MCVPVGVYPCVPVCVHVCLCTHTHVNEWEKAVASLFLALKSLGL